MPFRTGHEHYADFRVSLIGTATLNDLLGRRGPVVESDTPLKRAVDGTILVPQPSDDPDDPLVCPTIHGGGLGHPCQLRNASGERRQMADRACFQNWPLWRRDMITFFLCLLSVLASTLSPLLAANTLTLLEYYGGAYSTTDMALLTGYHLLGVAISGFFVVPLARVWVSPAIESNALAVSVIPHVDSQC